MNNLKNNKLIAEFMGGINEMPKGYILYCCIPDKLCKDTHFFKPEDMQFHSSWDWFMPVVAKIESLTIEKIPTFVQIEWNYCFIYGATTIHMERKSKLEAVYDAVIEFIKLYNKQKN